jgi:hypothetical protein
VVDGDALAWSGANKVRKNIGISEFRCIMDENDLMSNPSKISRPCVHLDRDCMFLD